MTKTVLLAVDATCRDAEQQVAAAARNSLRLSPSTGERVLVLHVHETVCGRFGPQRVDCIDGEGEKAADAIATALMAEGIAADYEVRTADFGDVPGAILAAAEEHGARIMALGSDSGIELTYLPYNISDDPASRFAAAFS